MFVPSLGSDYTAAVENAISRADTAMEAADFTAMVAWDRTKGQPSPERLLAAITEAAEVLERLAVELTTGP